MYPDFGYMEEGKLGRPYDLKLMARLGEYLRPYWRPIALSIFFILIMAAMDLLVPYLTKEAIDRYIIPSAREVFLRGEDPSAERRFEERYGEDLIPRQEKGRFLLPPEAAQRMDRKEMQFFQKSGIVSETRYYLFIPRGPEDEKMLGRYPLLFETSGPYGFIPFDRMKELRPQDLLILRGDDLRGVLGIALLVVLILMVHFGLNFFQVYTMEIAGQRMMHDLRMKVFSHLQGLSISFFDKNPVGRLVTRLTNDIQNVHEMFTSVLINLFRDVLLLIGIIFILLHLNPELAFVSYSLLPLIFITTLVFSRRARDVFREIRSRVAQMNSFLQESLSGMRVVQLFRREEENARRFQRINRGHYLANMNQIKIYALFVPLIEILSSGAIGLLLWYGGGRVLQEAITLGVLVAFLSYIRMFFQPIRDLSEKYNILQSAMASLERIFSLLDRDEKAPVPLSPKKDRIRGEIEFRNVSFSYGGAEKVLTDVSFSVKEGERVAIVGATGAGKTSLLNLLERFYEVEEGSILVDGIDIRQWDLSRLRSQIGLVMQDTFLFAGDIAENIRLGENDGDDGKVRAAAQAVNAERFILQWPSGYRTKVGEGGKVLSAGEKQLLAFARALSIDPKILILDEATSHVDPETERLAHEGMVRLLRGRTGIIIAHRLSTIRHVDRIIVLHKGSVREMGTHQELMAKRGLYFRLFQLQYGKKDEGEPPFSP